MLGIVQKKTVSRHLKAVVGRVVQSFQKYLYDGRRKFDSQISHKWFTLVNDYIWMKTEHV